MKYVIRFLVSEVTYHDKLESFVDKGMECHFRHSRLQDSSFVLYAFECTTNGYLNGTHK